MAKGLRSNNQKALRHARRAIVKATEPFQAGEEARFAKMAQTLAQADERRKQAAAERPVDMATDVAEERGRSGRLGADGASGLGTSEPPSQAGAAEKMEVDTRADARKHARLAARKGKGFKVKAAKKVRSVLNEEFHKRRTKGTRRGAFKRDILGAAEG